MGLQHWKRRVIEPAPKPKPAERLMKAAKEMRQIAQGKKRGPKPSGNAKQLLTLRLDPDVIEKFRATGKGWQSRMNDVLKAAKV